MPKVTQTAGQMTHTGVLLTLKQSMFIDRYVETGNAAQAVVDVGYKTNAPYAYASELLHKQPIKEEIEYRLKKRQSQKIADGREVMEFFTKVMNGEINDQFGLEAALADRLKAAYEIAKRTIDIENKLQETDVKIVIERKNLNKVDKRRKKKASAQKEVDE